MVLGDILTVEELASPTKMNAKVTTWTDALTLSQIGTTPCMRVIPTTTGYGFTKDLAMRRNADNNAWIVDGLHKHHHRSDTDDDGGTINDMFLWNMGQFVDIDMMHACAEDYVTMQSGTGSAVFNDINDSGGTSRMTLEAGTDNNGNARVLKYGINIGFAYYSRFQTAFDISSSSNMIFRTGIGAEKITTSNNSLRKYGIEGCSAAPEGTVILLFSADNVTRSTQASVFNITDSNTNYLMQHSPSLNIKLIKGGSNTNMVNKTSNIPSTGNIVAVSGDDHGIIKTGIKTTASSSDKFMYLFGQRFVGRASTAKWSVKDWVT